MNVLEIANKINEMFGRHLTLDSYYIKYRGHQLTEEDMYDYIGMLLEDIDEMQKRIDDYRENYELIRSEPGGLNYGKKK